MTTLAHPKLPRLADDAGLTLIGVAIAVAVTLPVSVLTAFLTGTVMRGKGDAGIKEAVDN